MSEAPLKDKHWITTSKMIPGWTTDTLTLEDVAKTWGRITGSELDGHSESVIAIAPGCDNALIVTDPEVLDIGDVNSLHLVVDAHADRDFTFTDLTIATSFDAFDEDNGDGRGRTLPPWRTATPETLDDKAAGISSIWSRGATTEYDKPVCDIIGASRISRSVSTLEPCDMTAPGCTALLAFGVLLEFETDITGNTIPV
jgi:hypothetical protein